MKLVCLDSTAVVSSGPGSPAFFSRYAIEYLRAAGHEVTIANGFDPELCTTADAVWTEWGNTDAFEAAQSGLCRKLLVRMRGFDAFGPLDRLDWPNVDALVYESPFMKRLVEERLPGLRGFRSHVIPSGIDVDNIPFKERKAGPVVAMVARGVADKGFQLAFEWARQRPDIQLHVALAMPEPRLLRYLEYTKPLNVTIYPQVDTVKWLDEINANFLLSASNWESLGYTIAEAMAMGIKPLIHDTPGSELNWPSVGRWDSLSMLGILVGESPFYGAALYTSSSYRHFVEEHLDAYRQSRKFADLLTAPAPPRALKVPPSAGQLVGQAEHFISTDQLEQADRALLEFRDRAPRLHGLDDTRAGLSFRLAMAYYAKSDLSNARVWALRSLDTVVRSDAFCLLGEIAAAEGDVENAERWYCASLDLGDVPTRYPSKGLIEESRKRWRELDKEIRLVELPRAPSPVRRFLAVVAVRNAEKYIGACLESIKAQTQRFRCVVVDDASTDGTFAAIADAVGSTTLDTRFLVLERGARRHSLRNIADVIQKYGEPGDVVVIVDGDDKLDPCALSMIEDAYVRGAWMTYGNFVTSSGERSWMAPYPRRVIEANAFRAWPWSVSHPKTFRKELFDHIKIEDFQHEGQWFQTAGDVALMLPMLEMAAERALYLSHPIYVWNDQNMESDHRVDPDGQVRVRDLILAKPRYDRLEKL